VKFEGKSRERGRASLERGSKLEGLGESCKLPQCGAGQSPDRFGCTKSPENASSRNKCSLVPDSQFDLAEPLDDIGSFLLIGSHSLACHNVSITVLFSLGTDPSATLHTHDYIYMVGYLQLKSS